MEAIAVETHGSLGCKVMADDRFRVSRVQVPSRIQYFLFVDSHSHALTKMFSAGGYHKFQPEDAGPLQTVVEPAVERAIPPVSSLNVLHQNPKSLSILVCY
jgi:hypothetical protein